jgi:hypothetical protein
MIESKEDFYLSEKLRQKKTSLRKFMGQNFLSLYFFRVNKENIVTNVNLKISKSEKHSEIYLIL